jgi:predicted nucleic acid-binding protein
MRVSAKNRPNRCPARFRRVNASPRITLSNTLGVGSVLLIPELLSKPLRDHEEGELAALSALLGRLDLLPMDQATAELAAALGSTYRLRAADAVHLATAVGAGADRFITNNRADFPKLITEIDVTYPDELSDPAE